MISNYKDLNNLIKVKYIEPSEIAQKDIDDFKFQSARVPFNTSTTKRMICVSGLTLVNPVIKDKRNSIIYWELDSNKQKYRKTARYSYVVVQTDNLGDVEFKSDQEDWKDVDQLMQDEGLYETVIVQRLIDALNGIDITSNQRRYNKQETSDKIPRNKKVVLRSPDGEMVFIKYKKTKPMLDMGYQII
jgi:hypothetical protein